MLSDTIEAAQAPGVFSLDKFLTNVAYPEESVTLFTNALAVNELIKLRVERETVQGHLADAIKEARKNNQRTVGGEVSDATKVKTALEERVQELQSQIEEWDDKVAESALTFKLRGMPPQVVEEITNKHFFDKHKDYSGEPEEEARDYELIARSIIRVEDANGHIDTHPFTSEDVKNLRGKILAGEYLRLVQSVAHVNLNGALFEQATDASFLSRRSNVAG